MRANMCDAKQYAYLNGLKPKIFTISSTFDAFESIVPAFKPHIVLYV